MSKAMKKFVNKAGASVRGISRGRGQRHQQEGDNDSPRGVAVGFEEATAGSSSVEDSFRKKKHLHSHNTTSTAGRFDEAAFTTLPIHADGEIRNNTSKSSSAGGFGDEHNDFDITDPPSDGEYDFGHEAFYDFRNEPTTTEADAVALHKSNSSNSRRSKSVQRPLQQQQQHQGQGAVEGHRRNPSRSRRSQSTGRSSQTQTRNNDASQATNESAPNSKKRKSKMEKILQLQEKNQRYKDEFRKVQKDRKSLKKELESKRLEIASLTKEIGTQVAESSILKLKLSEALQQLDKTDQGERKDKSSITKLQKELSQVRGDYNAAVSRVARMREEVESLRVSVHRKDDQIKSLTAEVTEQTNLVDALQGEILMLRKRETDYGEDAEKVSELRQENTRLQTELASTLERASSMVKEREDAISDLLKENEEMKRLVASHAKQEEQEQDTDSIQISQDEIAHLRDELDAAEKALEESQDRNIALEEEVEAWITKGEQMESATHQLQEDIDAWQSKAMSAEETLKVVEASAQESAKRAVSAEAALEEAEKQHQKQIHDMEHRHTEALLDQKEKAAQRLAEAEKITAPNPQEMMLQKAVADRKAKQAGKGWGSALAQRVLTATNGEPDEELSDEQKRIKELEAINTDREEEVKQAKSELVRLRSTYNDTMYKNKKRIQELEKENNAYAAKLTALELEMATIKKFQNNSFPDLLSDTSTSSATTN